MYFIFRALVSQVGYGSFKLWVQQVKQYNFRDIQVLKWIIKYNDVWVAKKDTNRSSNTLLRLVPFFATQTLPLQFARLKRQTRNKVTSFIVIEMTDSLFETECTPWKDNTIHRLWIVQFSIMVAIIKLATSHRIIITSKSACSHC